MSLRKKIIILFILTLIIEIGLGSYILIEKNEAIALLQTKPEQIIATVENDVYFSSLSQQLRYYDEILTQSARNYAFTGDIDWKNRYYEAASKMNLALSEASGKSDKETNELFDNINQVNDELVEIETQAIENTDQGKGVEGLAELNSNNYLEQKRVLKTSLEEYYTKQGRNIDLLVENSFESLSTVNEKIIAIIKTNGLFVIFLLLITLLLIILTYLFVYIFIIKRIDRLLLVVIEITRGNLNEMTKDKENDEIGLLATSINQMTNALKKTNDDFEDKVLERTESLEKINKYITSRELKMIELKKKIKALEALLDHGHK